MIVSDNPNRVNSRWLQACVVLCAIFMLPFGVAYAQNYDAVEKRLEKAVKKGHLTRDQAGVMMNALRKSAGDEKGKARKVQHEDNGDIEDKLKAIGGRLKAAVKTGKLSEEEAWTKWREIKEKSIAPRLKAAVKEGKMSEEKAVTIWREIEKAEAGERLKTTVEAGRISKEAAGAKKAEIWKKDRKAAERENVAKYRAVETRIRAAVEAGKLSKEDAERKLIGMRMKMAKQGEDREGERRRLTREDYVRTEADMKKAVAKGAISVRDAHGRLGEMRKMMGRQREGAAKTDATKKFTREDLMNAQRRIRQGIADGKISKEDGRARLEAMRKMMARQREGAAKTDATKKFTREDLMNAGRRIRQGIADGKISEEDGRARLEAMRKMMGEQRGEPRSRWEGIKKRIEGAVKKGDITREEADAKYKEIQKRMAGEHGQ